VRSGMTRSAALDRPTRAKGRSIRTIWSVEAPSPATRNIMSPAIQRGPSLGSAWSVKCVRLLGPSWGAVGRRSCGWRGGPGRGSEVLDGLPVVELGLLEPGRVEAGAARLVPVGPGPLHVALLVVGQGQVEEV